MKERERNSRLLTLLNHLISESDEESIELIGTMIEGDTEAMQQTFWLMKESWEGKKEEIIARGPIQHEDLSTLYDEEGFDKDFEFIGNDGDMYTFLVDNFEYLMREYRGDAVMDCISTVNGSIKHMLDQGICKKIEIEEAK